MAELRRVLGGLGLTGVETYLQSGNAVFDAERNDAARIVAANPFAGAADVDEQYLHATFLLESTGESEFGVASEAAFSAVYQAAFSKLTLPAAAGERAAFVGSPVLAVPVVYLYLPNGYGRTKLSNAYFERSLGAAATTRNWRTVLALAEMSARAA